MCGIAGYFDIHSRVESVEREAVLMADAIAHRGPDASGVWVGGDRERLAMAHRRLSIIDVSDAGAQPMASQSGRYVIVFNGEIYNFRALREELSAAGCAFKGHSDTEVLLAAFEVWGIEAALKRAVGMFALALYDLKEERLILARDRLGKKPLYYGWNDDGKVFAFSSELKAFRAIEAFKSPEVNPDVTKLYLQWRYIPDPYTIYKNIYKLLPSSYIEMPLNGFKKPFDIEGAVKQYWDFEAVVGQERLKGSEDEILDGLEAVLQQSIDERMISDVPLGAFLSGGVDSALIVAMMQKNSDQPVNSYTIAFDDPRYNEAEIAKEIAKRLGTKHTEMVLKPQEALDSVQDLAVMFDEPFADPSAIPTFQVCRLAREKITVALTGDGGDESFGGYSWYRRAQKLSLFMKLPRALRVMMADIFEALPHGLARMSKAQRQKIAGLMRAGNMDDFYPLIHSYWNAVSGQAYDQDFSVAYDRLKGEVGIDTPIARMMAYDTQMFLAGDVLTKVDRCSMMNSLELRSPLLDTRVIEYAWSMPHEMKIRNDAKGTQKYALKQLLRRYLPDALIDRPKQGFSIPHGQWLKDDLRDWGEAMLSPDAIDSQGLIAPELVTPYWEAHKQGRADYGHYLWTIACLQNWGQTWK